MRKSKRDGGGNMMKGDGVRGSSLAPRSLHPLWFSCWLCCTLCTISSLVSGVYIQTCNSQFLSFSVSHPAPDTNATVYFLFLYARDCRRALPSPSSPKITLFASWPWRRQHKIKIAHTTTPVICRLSLSAIESCRAAAD